MPPDPAQEPTRVTRPADCSECAFTLGQLQAEHEAVAITVDDEGVQPGSDQHGDDGLGDVQRQIADRRIERAGGEHQSIVESCDVT